MKLWSQIRVLRAALPSHPADNLGLRATDYERTPILSNIVDIQTGAEPGIMGQRAVRVFHLALADGASPMMAVIVGSAVDQKMTEEEFFETNLGVMKESDLRRFLTDEIKRQLHRLDLRRSTPERQSDMPEIRFTQDDGAYSDRSLRIIDEQLDRELGNIPSWLTDEDVETVRGLLYRQIRPYAATFLGIVATAKTVVDECGGQVEGLKSFVDQAMWAIYELTGSIEVPDSIFDSAVKDDELSDAIYEIREKVRAHLDESTLASA